MTKVIDGVKVLTFEEWSKIPEVKADFDQSEDCDSCDGSGEHECECGDTHECNACDGSGKISDLPHIYRNLLKLELEHLLSWREGLALKHLAGFPNPDPYQLRLAPAIQLNITPGRLI